MKKRYPDLPPQTVIDDLQKSVEGLEQICFVAMITKKGSYLFSMAPNQKAKDLREFRRMLSGNIRDIEEEERECKKKK